MLGIYKLDFDCGRMGSLEGIFVADSEHVKKIMEKYLHFGEVLGKHSQISGPIEDGDIELVTENKEAVEIVEKYKLTNGYNPFHYWTCNYCGSKIDPETEKCINCTKNE